MTRTESLRSLETLLESFIQKAVAQKENRLSILDGVNRLDDIARQENIAEGVSADLGEWLADHTNWLDSNVILPHDADRIKNILGNIADELKLSADQTQETQKIQSEITRWNERLQPKTEELKIEAGKKIVLRRGPETVEEKLKDSDTIAAFSRFFGGMIDRWEEAARGRQHVMSALDDLLNSAYLQQNEEALLLSAFVIYYLRHKGYKVEPFVKRLKAAESLIKEKVKTS